MAEYELRKANEMSHSEKQACADIAEWYASLAGDASGTVELIANMSDDRLLHAAGVLNCCDMLFDMVMQERRTRKNSRRKSS